MEETVKKSTTIFWDDVVSLIALSFNALVFYHIMNSDTHAGVTRDFATYHLMLRLISMRCETH